MTAFASQLRRLRKERGMTQEQLANLLHVTRQTISNWENDRAQPDYGMLSDIAAMFEVSLAALLGEEAVPMQEPLEAAAPEPEDVPVEPIDAPEQPDSEAIAPDTPEQPVCEAIAPAAQQSAPRRAPAVRLALLFVPVLLLALGAVGFGAFRMRHARPSDAPFTLEQFTAAAQQTQGAAYLRVYTRENSGYYIQARPEAEPRWNVRFFMQETGGVGLDIDMLTSVLFMKDGTQHVYAETGVQFKESIGHPHIAPGEMRIYTWNASAEPDALGVGLEIRATDENGCPLVFYAYQPLEYAAR